MPRSSHPGHIDVQSSRRGSVHVFQLAPGCNPETLYRHVTGQWPSPDIAGMAEGGSISSSSTSELMQDDLVDNDDAGSTSDFTTGSSSSKSRKRRKVARKSKKSEIWFPRAEMAFCICISYIPPSGRTKIKFLGKSLGRNELIAVICSLATRRLYNRKQISSHSQVLKDKVPSPYKELLTFDDKVKMSDDDGSGATIERYVFPEPIYRLIGFLPNTDLSNARKPDWLVDLEAREAGGNLQPSQGYVYPPELNPNFNSGIQNNTFGSFPQQPPPHQYPALTRTDQTRYPSPPPHIYPTSYNDMDGSHGAGTSSHSIPEISYNSVSFTAASRNSIASSGLDIQPRRCANSALPTSPTTSYHTGPTGTPTLEAAQPQFWTTTIPDLTTGTATHLSGSIDNGVLSSSQGPDGIFRTHVQYIWRNDRVADRNDGYVDSNKTESTHDVAGGNGGGELGVGSETWYNTTMNAGQKGNNISMAIADTTKSDVQSEAGPKRTDICGNALTNRSHIGCAPTYPRTVVLHPQNLFIPASLEISAKLPPIAGEPYRNSAWILSSAQPLVLSTPIAWNHINIWQARYPFLEDMVTSSIPAFHIEVPLRLPESPQARTALFETSDHLRLRLVLRATCSDSPGYNLVTDTGFVHYKTTNRYPREIFSLRRMYGLAEQPIHVDGCATFGHLTELYRHMAQKDLNTPEGQTSDNLAGIAAPMSVVVQMVVPDSEGPGIEPTLPANDWTRALMVVVYSFYVQPSSSTDLVPICRQIDFGAPPRSAGAGGSLVNQLVANEERKPSHMIWH